MEIKIGDQGPEVGKIQEDLSRLGFYHGRIDRDFGRLTEAAVKEYQRQTFVTGVADDATQAAIARDLNLPRVVDAPPRPINMVGVVDVFGEIKFVDVGGGRIKITNGWAEDNIKAVTLPVVGKEMVHRKLIGVLADVMEQVQKQNLSSEIRQFAVWAPRHKMHDPTRPLSIHSWGVACDVNWSENPPGHASRLHPGIVSIFETAGFFWGAKFQREPDPMHFQWATGC